MYEQAHALHKSSIHFLFHINPFSHQVTVSHSVWTLFSRRVITGCYTLHNIIPLMVASCLMWVKDLVERELSLKSLVSGRSINTERILWLIGLFAKND